MKHPLPNNTKIIYNGRGRTCKRPPQPRQGQITKSVEINGVYFYGLKNGKIIDQDKILEID